MSLNIIPVGHRILVRPDKVEKQTKGGIYIPEEARDKEQRATNVGVVLAIGPLAWKDFAKPDAWAEVGDTVIFKAHAGMRVKNEESDEDFLLLMNDAEVAAVRKENS